MYPTGAREQMRRVTLAMVTLASFAAFGCGGSDDGASPTAVYLLQHVPKSEIDGTISSTRFEPAPANAHPAISARLAALQVPSDQQDKILETVLVSYTDLVAETPAPRLVWVVNFNPAEIAVGIPGGCFPPCRTASDSHAVYSYVVVDATTGEALFSARKDCCVETPPPTPAP